MGKTPSGDDVEFWREAIGALAEWACTRAPGNGTRDKTDPVYVEVTEGRDRKGSWQFYSSCADLGHWLAKRCGVREAWVNRTDDDFAGPWEPVKNVGKLGSPATHTPVGYLPERGDILILSNFPWPRGSDHHVCVYLGPNPAKPGEHCTANYGAAGLANTPINGAKISSKPLKVELSKLVYGSKTICRVLTVPNLIGRINAKPDLSGPEPWTTGEVLDYLDTWPKL